MIERNDTDLQALEVVPLSAIHAMERAQIDTQVATAHQYPRSIEQFKKRSLAMVSLDLETAESCIYCRPVGKEKNDRGQWVEKFAEGPSIRLAEIVACCYGNIRAASRIVEQTPRSVKAEGACHDLETNYAGKSDCVEATVKQDGTPYSERQAALIAKVACAKAYRDAIFRVVPRALCKPAFEAAKKIVAGEGKTITDRVNRVKKWLEQRKIDERRALAVLGIGDWAQTTEEHLMTLTGLRTAVQDGDDPADIFPYADSASQSPHAPEPTPMQKAQQAAAAPAAAPQPMSAAQQAAAVEAKRRGRPPGSKNKVEKLTPQEAAAERKKGMEVAPSAIAYPEGTGPEDYDADGNPLPKQAYPAAPTPEPQQADDTDLAAMGLAPEPEKAPEAPTPEPAPEPAAAPAQEPMEFKARAGEDSAAANKRALGYLGMLMEDGNVTPGQLLAFCKKNNLSREGQKLTDLATDKLFNLGKNWAVLLPKIAAFPS